MVPLWDLLHSAEPYAKTIEYAVIFVTLVAAIYATHKIRSGAKEIRTGAKEIQDLEARLSGVSSKMMELTREVVANFEKEMSGAMQGVRGQLADLVERRQGQTLQGPQVEDQEEEEEAPRSASLPPPPQQQEESSGDAYDRHQQWWQPIVDMKFDDPQQEQPRLHWMNNTRTPLPWPSIWLTAWRNESPDGVCGVALSGRAKRINELWRRLRRDAAEIQRELPEGSTVEGGRFGIGLTKPNSEFRDDDEKRAWLKSTLNTFVNVLRPRIAKAASRTSQRTGDGVAAFDQQGH